MSGLEFLMQCPKYSTVPGLVHGLPLLALEERPVALVRSGNYEVEQHFLDEFLPSELEWPVVHKVSEAVSKEDFRLVTHRFWRKAS